MRISFQLNAASPLQIKDFFRKLEVPVELTVQGTYPLRLSFPTICMAK